MTATIDEPRPSGPMVWVRAARPATLLACAVPVLVGSALAASAGRLRLDAALFALASAGMIQIGTNLYNDYEDFRRGADTSARLGPARATQRGWLAPGRVLAAAVACFALSIALGMVLVSIAGWPVLVIGLVSVLCGVAYTGGPLPLAYHGLGDVFVWVFFGIVAVCGTYFIQTEAVSWSVFLASNAVGALASAILVVNNLRDRVTDAAASKRTLAVRFGARAARIQYAMMVAFAFLAPAAGWAAGLVGPWWLLSLGALPLGLWEIRAIWRLDGAALNPHLGATARLELAFGLLLSIGIVLDGGGP